MSVRTVIERGPKGKRSVAFGIDWPGWSRGARSAELALETLESYRERYRPVAGLAGMAREFDAAGRLEVVEATIPHPALCLPHARPCVGDGGQGPLRVGRGCRRAPRPISDVLAAIMT